MVDILNPVNIDRCLRISTIPVIKLGYYEGTSDSYQVVAQWTVEHIGYLDEISFATIGTDYALFKLTIDSTVVFENIQTVGDICIKLGKIKFPTGTVITLSVKSDGINKIKINGHITGRDINDYI